MEIFFFHFRCFSISSEKEKFGSMALFTTALDRMALKVLPIEVNHTPCHASLSVISAQRRSTQQQHFQERKQILLG